MASDKQWNFRALNDAASDLPERLFPPAHSVLEFWFASRQPKI